ncbi:MAG: histidinol-phosphate transaminase, partial [Verrucomicrobiota bacterium]
MPSLIRNSVQQLHGYVPGEQPDDPDIVKLNTNENPYPPSPAVEEALRNLGMDVLRLYPDPVCRRLRERLGEIHGCGPEQVFVGNGSDEFLALCLRAYVERDGSVGYFDPSYSLYPILSAIEDLETRPVTLPEDFGWTMPEDYAASLFFLTHPNAPTSLLFPDEAIRDFCRTFPGVVVIDEAYVDFADRHYMDLALNADRVLVTRTLSKSCSLAAIRLGYAIGPVPLIEALYKIKDSYNVNGLSQAVALAALSDPDWMADNVARIKRTRTRVSEALRTLGWRVLDSQTNFLWAEPAKIPAQKLFEELRRRCILVR